MGPFLESCRLWPSLRLPKALSGTLWSEEPQFFRKWARSPKTTNLSLLHTHNHSNYGHSSLVCSSLPIFVILPFKYYLLHLSFLPSQASTSTPQINISSTSPPHHFWPPSSRHSPQNHWLGQPCLDLTVFLLYSFFLLFFKECTVPANISTPYIILSSYCSCLLKPEIFYSGDWSLRVLHE